MDATSKRIVDTYNYIVRDYSNKPTEWHYTKTIQSLYALYRIDATVEDIEEALNRAQD